MDAAPDAGVSRRSVLIGAAATATAGVAGAAAASDDASKADFLFVQTADSMAFAADANRLTLRDVGPSTLFFTDRPERIAGNMSTESFIPFWSEGTGELRQVVVELRDPRMVEGNLEYTVKLIEGDMPVLADDVSLFIDVIGMPLTPLSYAGVRRRAYRRAVLR
jgi:hypothetical protein